MYMGHTNLIYLYLWATHPVRVCSYLHPTSASLFSYIYVWGLVHMISHSYIFIHVFSVVRLLFVVFVVRFHMWRAIHTVARLLNTMFTILSSSISYIIGWRAEETWKFVIVVVWYEQRKLVWDGKEIKWSLEFTVYFISQSSSGLDGTCCNKLPRPFSMHIVSHALFTIAFTSTVSSNGFPP